MKKKSLMHSGMLKFMTVYKKHISHKKQSTNNMQEKLFGSNSFIHHQKKHLICNYKQIVNKHIRATIIKIYKHVRHIMSIHSKFHKKCAQILNITITRNTPTKFCHVLVDLRKIILLIIFILVAADLFISCKSLEKSNEENGLKTQSKVIYDDENYKEFQKYCQSDYKRHRQENGYTLKKLIVFHRHGDRAALDIKNTDWSKMACKSCDLKNNNISSCQDTKCTDGLLTIKGYWQMIKLGRFIKSNYPEFKDDFEDIYMRCTSINRTQTSLHGVYYGLTGKEIIRGVDIQEYSKDTLLIQKHCDFLIEKLQNTISNYFVQLIQSDDKLKKGSIPEKRADLYLTYICNKIELQCEEVNCDEKIIHKYIKTMEDSWKYQSEALAKDEQILKMTFGRFVSDMYTILDNKKKINILSAHDVSISMLLAGFGVEKYQHPPYASAIFFEVWNKDDKMENDDVDSRVIRIVYNDILCKTTIDEEVNIPYDKFMKYLEILAITDEQLKRDCKIKGASNEVISNRSNEKGKQQTIEYPVVNNSIQNKLKLQEP